MTNKITVILTILLLINLPLTTALADSFTGRQVTDYPSDFQPKYPPKELTDFPVLPPKLTIEQPVVPVERPIVKGFCGDQYCDLEGIYGSRENEISCAFDCKKIKEELVEPTCSDTDGDVQLFKEGTVSGITIVGEKYSESDKCLMDDNKKLFLKEYYCYQGYSQYENNYCPEGYSCFDGACRALKCEDGTEGAIYSYPDGRQFLQENKCQGSTLLRFKCGGSEYVECAYGCNSFTNSCFDKSKKSKYCVDLRSPQPKGVESGESWLDSQENMQTKGESYPDYCEDKILNHFTCEGSIVRLKSSFCPNGCDPVKQACNPSGELATPIPEEKSPQKFFENLQQGLVCLKQCPDCMDKPQPSKGIACNYLLSPGIWSTASTPKWPELPKEKEPAQQAVSIIINALKQSSCSFNPKNYDAKESDIYVKIDFNKNLRYKFKDAKIFCYECHFDLNEKKLNLKGIDCNLNFYDYDLNSNLLESTNLITGNAIQDPQKELFKLIYGDVMSFIEGLMKVQEDNNSVEEIQGVNQCLLPLDLEIKKAIDYLSTCSDDSAITALMNAVNQINLANGNINDAYKHLQYGMSPFTEEFISKLFDPEGLDTDFALSQSRQKGEKQKSIDLETLKKKMDKIHSSNLKYDLQDSIKTFDNVNNRVIVESLKATISSMPQSSCPGVNDFLKEARDQIELVKFYDTEVKKGLSKAKEYSNSINDDIRNSIFNAMIGNTFVNYAAHQNVRASLSGMKASIAFLNAVLESVKCVQCPLSQAKYTNDEGKCVECAKCGPGRIPAVNSQFNIPELRKAELAKALEEGNFEKIKKIIDELKGQEVVPKEKTSEILTTEQEKPIESIAKNNSEAVKNYANNILTLIKKAEIVNFEENTVLIDQVLLFIRNNSALLGDKAISSEKIIDFIQQIQGEDYVNELYGKASLEEVKNSEKVKYRSYGLLDLFRSSFEGSSFSDSLFRILSKIITFNYEDYKNPYTPQEPLSAVFLDKIRHLESKNELELVMKIYSMVEEMIKVYEDHSEFCKTMEEVLLKGKGICRDFAALLYHSLKERGIDVEYVDGFTEKITEGHIWVRVRITVENIPMEFDLDPTRYKEFFPLHPREFKIENEQSMNYFKKQAFEQPAFLATRLPTSPPVPILKTEQKGWFGKTWESIWGKEETEAEKLKKTVLDRNEDVEKRISAIWRLPGAKGSENFQELKDLLLNSDLEDELRVKVMFQLYFHKQEEFLREHPELNELIKKDLTQAKSAVEGNERILVDILSWHNSEQLVELFRNPAVSDKNKIYLVLKLINLKYLTEQNAFFSEVLNFIKNAMPKEENRPFLSIIMNTLMYLKDFDSVEEVIATYQLTLGEKVEIISWLLDSNKQGIITRIPNAEDALEELIRGSSSYKFDERIMKAIKLLKDLGKFGILKNLFDSHYSRQDYKIYIAEQLVITRNLPEEELPQLIQFLEPFITKLDIPLEIRASALRTLVVLNGLERFRGMLLDPQLSTILKRNIIESISTLYSSVYSRYDEKT
ncbi:transglutaminase domain-containing protein, partial [archaeon]|nr:transglutaminase domain-containing protein [archaeon]